MVAVIKVSGSMHRIFNYNENKVREGVAECIGAGNYPLNANEMSAKIKLNFLVKRLELNENVKRNSIHISLNFPPSESYLNQDKLSEIAGIYMDKLGFGDQPYLLYQHYDAAHPHIHIVTTNIRSDGSRIDLHHLGIRKSEPARKEIEKMFGLVVADDQQRRQAFQLEPVNAAKIQYGRSATKRAITNVLNTVLEKYHYASLPELNAVLGLYNVRADRGSENSRIHQNGGLVYRITDQQEKPVGVPTKASDFYSKPTLKYLEARYAANQVSRHPHKARVRNAVDLALMGRRAATLDQLVSTLEKQGISAVIRRSETGVIYGITYVDHKTHCVFNGSSLGKPYSAKTLLERCQTANNRGQQPSIPVSRSESFTPNLTSGNLPVDINCSSSAGKWPAGPDLLKDTLDTLLQPTPPVEYVPAELRRKRKRKRRKNVSNQ